MYFPSPYDDSDPDDDVNDDDYTNALSPTDFGPISYLCPADAPFELSCWQKRLPSPRCKPASHYARCVAHILCNRPCERPMTAPGVYADDITKRTVIHEIHTEAELSQLTKAKYGSQFFKRDIFHLPVDTSLDRSGDGYQSGNDCCFGNASKSGSQHTYEHKPLYEYEYEPEYELEFEPEYEYEYEVGPNGKLRIKLDEKGNKVLKLDQNGKPIPKRDANGQIIYKRDLMGNPIPLKDEHGRNVYKKDAAGKRIKKRDKNGQIVYKTDGKGRKVAKVDALSGKPLVRRDSNGNKIVKLDKHGNPIFQVPDDGNGESSEDDENSKGLTKSKSRARKNKRGDGNWDSDEDDMNGKGLTKSKSRARKNKRSLSKEAYVFMDLNIKRNVQAQQIVRSKKSKSKRKFRKEDSDEEDYVKPRRSRKLLQQVQTDAKDKTYKDKQSRSTNQYEDLQYSRSRKNNKANDPNNTQKRKSKQKLGKDDYEDSKSAPGRSYKNYDKQYDANSKQKDKGRNYDDKREREESRSGRRNENSRVRVRGQSSETSKHKGKSRYGKDEQPGRNYDTRNPPDNKQYKNPQGYEKGDYSKPNRGGMDKSKDRKGYLNNGYDDSRPNRGGNDKSMPSEQRRDGKRNEQVGKKRSMSARNDQQDRDRDPKGNIKMAESTYRNRRNDYSVSTERKQEKSPYQKDYGGRGGPHKGKSYEFIPNKVGERDRQYGTSPSKNLGKKRVDYGNDSKYYKSIGPKYMDTQGTGDRKIKNDKRNIVVNKSMLSVPKAGMGDRKSKFSVRLRNDGGVVGSGDAGSSSFEHSSAKANLPKTVSIVNAERMRKVQRGNLKLAQVGSKPSRYHYSRMLPDPRFVSSRYDFKKKFKTKQAKIKEKLSRIMNNQPFRPPRLSIGLEPSRKDISEYESETGEELPKLDEYGSVRTIKSKIGIEGDTSNSYSDPQLNLCWQLARNLYRKQAVKVLAIPNPSSIMNFVQDRYSDQEWVKGKAVATRFYPNGQTFCAAYGNYSSQIFYPHGGLAVAISAPDPVNHVLVFRDPYDDFYFVEESILAEFDGMGKGTVLDSEGVVKLQYNIDGGFMLEEVEKLSKRWDWNPGGQRIILKLNRYLSLRIMDIEQIHLIFNGNKRGIRFNVGPTGLPIKLIGTDTTERGSIPPCVADNYDYINGRFNTPLGEKFDSRRMLKNPCTNNQNSPQGDQFSSGIPTVYYHPASKYSTCTY